MSELAAGRRHGLVSEGMEKRLQPGTGRETAADDVRRAQMPLHWLELTTPNVRQLVSL